MKDAEKLQRLIEIAWGNGWRLPEFGTKMHDTEPYPYWYVEQILSGYVGFQDEAIMVNESENSIIFDHEFIKALSRAKWGEIHYGTVDLEFSTCELRTFDEEGDVIKTEGINYKEKFSHDSMYSYYLARLAISDNRLEYLWQTFGGGDE